MYKVSVIVPVYNAERYVKKCVDSILNQTLKEIEVILINDGSTDNSSQIIDEYEQKYKRVRCIHQKNSGTSVARNNGINLARGQYIGFVDSDDYIEPNMYEELYKASKDENIQMAMCSYIEEDLYKSTSITVKAKLNSNTVYRGLDIEKNVISSFSQNKNYGFYSLCNKIYLREWLVQSGIRIDVNRDHGEDWWFNINVFSKLDSFIYVDKELYNYIHINKNSLMFKYRENQFDLFLDGRLKMKEVIPKEYMDESEFDKKFVYEFSSYIIRTIKEIENRKKRKELINKVISNDEVIECCDNVEGLPIHFRITSLLIKYRLRCLASLMYKVISILR